MRVNPEKALDIAENAIAESNNTPKFAKVYADIALRLGAGARATSKLRNLLESSSGTAERESLLESIAVLRTNSALTSINLESMKQKAGRPIENAIFVQMVKDEDDILLQCLEHAYQVGFRFFAIANNGSVDTSELKVKLLAQKHPDVKVLITFDPVVEYFQAEKTQALAKYAEAIFCVTGIKFDWIFPHDADEFFRISDSVEIDLWGLLDSADQKGVTTLTFPLINFASPEIISERPLENILTEFPRVVSSEKKTTLKVCYKNLEEARMVIGNHFVKGLVSEESHLLNASEVGAYLAHFPYRSREQIVRKIINGYKSVETSGLIGGGHWRDGYEKYQRRGLEYIDELLEKYMQGRL